MSDRVYVLAHFVAKPDRVDALHKLLESLLGTTRAEEGCVMYRLWRQDGHPGAFSLIEEWTSAAALDAHLAAPHLAEALPKLDDLLAEPAQIIRHAEVG
ncbi:MAG: antibiotic biosynthesis monooxygenase [Planctomycetota bacterium]